MNLPVIILLFYLHLYMFTVTKGEFEYAINILWHFGYSPRYQLDCYKPESLALVLIMGFGVNALDDNQNTVS